MPRADQTSCRSRSPQQFLENLQLERPVGIELRGNKAIAAARLHEIGEQRRFGVAATSLDDYKRIRKAHGGTVNDVVLAVVAGALRTWLLTRGESVVPSTTVRATSNRS